MHIYIYTYIYMEICVCIYIYIQTYTHEYIWAGFQEWQDDMLIPSNSDWFRQYTLVFTITLQVCANVQVNIRSVYTHKTEQILFATEPFCAALCACVSAYVYKYVETKLNCTYPRKMVQSPFVMKPYHAAISVLCACVRVSICMK